MHKSVVQPAHLRLVTRAPQEALAPLRQAVVMDRLLPAILDALTDFALVLNQDRQILAANRALLDAFGIEDGEALLGKRPGELLQCLFIADGPDGCGTGVHCTVCGAFKTVLESQDLQATSTSESRVTLHDGTAMDLQITCTPLALGEVNLTLCILKDISAEKRRNVLEKVFFHDVMNTIGSIRYIASMRKDPDIIKPEKEQYYNHLMLDLAEKLIDEIFHQRKLLAAEQGEFKPTLGIVSIPELMQGVLEFYLSNDISQGRYLVLGEVAECRILSDDALLRRILGNLVKNALEATEREGTVTMQCHDSGDTVTFVVHNDGTIPADVQLQLFQRSFSTKDGDGRGIGTYSIKLFGEKYLKGTVSFVSREPEGTSFYLTLPKIPPADRTPVGCSTRSTASIQRSAFSIQHSRIQSH